MRTVEFCIRENYLEIPNRFTLPTIYRYHRGMRWIPINKKTSKTNIAHHINNNYVVCVSKKLHENNTAGNRILHRRQVKANIRKINKMLYLKILVYNLINKFKNNDLDKKRRGYFKKTLDSRRYESILNR